jgi:hypothetical protein
MNLELRSRLLQQEEKGNDVGADERLGKPFLVLRRTKETPGTP